MDEKLEPLKPCPYRKARLGSLICTIASRDGSQRTDMTSVEVCRECTVPHILDKVNCINFSAGKTHSTAGPGGPIHRTDAAFDCEPIGFITANDYQIKCSTSCPSYQPIHKDISQHELIEVKGFDTSKASDKTLRQAVLAVLYGYHASHPERYGRFDLTPEFIANSLKMTVLDVVRVVAPMEEEGEVKTLKGAGQPYFSYIAITSKGVREIDSEPLFNKLDTAGVRVMGDQFNIDRSTVGAISTGDNADIDFEQEVQNALKNSDSLIELLRKDVTRLPEEDKSTALELIKDLKKELDADTPKQSKVKAVALGLKGFVEGVTVSVLAAYISQQFGFSI